MKEKDSITGRTLSRRYRMPKLNQKKKILALKIRKSARSIDKLMFKSV